MNVNTYYDCMVYLSICAIKDIIPDKELLSKFDINKIYKLCDFHKISVFIYKALKSANIKSDIFEEKLLVEKNRTLLFDVMRKKVIDSLNKNQIKFMLMKGIIINKFYPSPELREMSDNDIYYDKTRRDDLYKIMEGLKFTEYEYTDEKEKEYGCDTFIRKPVMNFEMHTSLFTAAHDEKLAQYYKDVNSKLIHKENYEYQFSNNDFYIYQTCHEYKHYSYVGIGIRALIDNYYIRKSLKETLDFQYIDNELKKVGAYQYEITKRNLVDKLFIDETTTNLTVNEKRNLEFFLTSGAYGTIDHYYDKMIFDMTGTNSNEPVSTNRKLKYYFRRLMGTKEIYESYFPKMSKHKILLPVCFILRLSTSVNKKNSIKRELHRLNLNERK